MAFKMYGKSPMTKKLCKASAYKEVEDSKKLLTEEQRMKLKEKAKKKKNKPMTNEEFDAYMKDPNVKRTIIYKK
tara:strand:- start:484 stop:705 length:222 start_codon:yes stop_codon:yes gene_type:complete